ncbi:MAG TPA: serine/threonine-protein kinase, partial [Pseudomonadota bacterium]|nr:serine/threonine-protein kinase [Pseudomonadota bacterium]
ALAAVHQRGLVHRDLKPSNIMLVADPDAPRGERAKLLDFGIVKILQEAAAIPIDDIEGQTQRGMILGTPLYMAPEQWKNNRRIDGKSDVYSLAVMMFLVLTGRMPFRAADTPALCFLHCNKAPPSLDSVDPSLPPALVDLVARMLAKDPRHRPTMDEVAAALGAILAQPAVARNQPMLPEPSELEIISEPEDDESSGVRPARSPMLAGEHPPLVDRQPSGQQSVPVRSLNSATLPAITPPSVAEAPAWADDNLTTASVAAAEPGALGQLPELSDGSLLVGSQYNLRPVSMLSVRAWVSTGALLVVVLLVIGINSFHFTPRQLGAGSGSGTFVAIPSTPPATLSLTPPAAPVSGPTPKAKLKRNCQHMMPNPSCLTGPRLTAPQQSAFLATFLHSDASLCPGDRLVVSGLPTAPRLQVVPKSMARKARASLLHDLKGLPGSLALPEQLEVICPDP